MRKPFIVILILFVFSLPVSAFGDCILNAKVDKNSIVVGDEIVLTVTLKYRDGEFCHIRDDVNFSKFKLLKKDFKTEKEGGFVVDTYSFGITPLELGEIIIPSVTVYTIPDAGYEDSEGNLSTPEIKIEVKGVISNEQEAKLKDILPPEKVYERTYFLLYIFLAIILSCILAYILIKYYKKRVKEEKRSQDAIVVEPQLTPYEEAMLSLKLLEEEKLISKFMYKELYLRLTEIVKRFIERFYGFNAVEMTTYELTIYLMDHPQANLDLKELKNFLNIADLVKFAKFTPDEESAYRDFNIVREIINKAARHTTDVTTGEVGNKK